MILALTCNVIEAGLHAWRRSANVVFPEGDTALEGIDASIANPPGDGRGWPCN